VAEGKRKLRTYEASATLPNIVALGRKLAPHEDIYHYVLTRTWPQFFLMVSVAFLIVNTVFAVLYTIQPGCIATSTGFGDDFFFSIQTLCTIGYGSMAPVTRYANVIVGFEALAGMLMTALVTGMTFVRFARPTAKILFSEKAIICTRDGIPHFMFRLGNWRRNQIVEAQLSVMVLLTEVTKEGEIMRRPAPLKLVRSTNPMFALTWTVMHKIDEESPFYGAAAMADLRKNKSEIYVSLTGYDETISQTIHARYRYALDDIMENVRFVDVLTTQEDGTRLLDFDKFHDVVAVEPAK